MSDEQLREGLRAFAIVILDRFNPIVPLAVFQKKLCISKRCDVCEDAIFGPAQEVFYSSQHYRTKDQLNIVRIASTHLPNPSRCIFDA